MKSICREHGKVVVWFVSLGFLFCLGLFWFFFFFFTPGCKFSVYNMHYKTQVSNKQYWLVC